MKFTVAKKLAIGFGALLILMAGLGWLAINKMDVINQQSTDMAENWMPSIRYVEEINTGTSDYRIAELTHVVSEKPAAKPTASKPVASKVTARTGTDDSEWEEF